MRVLSRLTGLLILLAIALTPRVSSAQTLDCEANLEEAERSYHLGKFNEAIRLLDHASTGPNQTAAEQASNAGELSCWQILKPNPQFQAHSLRLLALSHFAIDDHESAKVWVEELVTKVNPRFQPDPEVDPIFFRNEVTQNQKKLSRKRWFIIGGGLAVAGTVAAILIGPGSEPDPLSTPGDFFPPTGGQ